MGRARGDYQTQHLRSRDAMLPLVGSVMTQAEAERVTEHAESVSEDPMEQKQLRSNSGSRYNRSAKGRARERRYRKSAKGQRVYRAISRRYNRSAKGWLRAIFLSPSEAHRRSYLKD